MAEICLAAGLGNCACCLTLLAYWHNAMLIFLSHTWFNKAKCLLLLFFFPTAYIDLDCS